MKLGHRVITVRLAEPFRSASGTTAEVTQTVVEVGWGGARGFGTARGVPPDELDRCADVVGAAGPYELHRVLDALTAAGIGPATRCAVDLALHDLLGRLHDRPLRHLLGLAGLPIPPTALSLGAGSDRELRARGRELAGWPVLKLKLTAADDGSRVGVLRSVYPGRIRVDANGAWDPDRAVRVATELHRHGVELLEQPVPAGDLDGLRHVHERSPVPVFADEDCGGPEDVVRLRGRVGGVNVKLVRCGGIRGALATIAVARACGLRVMLGCKLESALGVSAAAQLAGLADHLDLDGHVRLVDDPFAGVRIDRGAVVLPDTAGLGVTGPTPPEERMRDDDALRSAG